MHISYSSLFPLAGALCSLLLGTAAVAQDECTTATAIVDGANGPFSNVGMTSSTLISGAPTPTCEPVTRFDKDIWFIYVASCTGPTTFSTCSAIEDTVLVVYAAPTGCAGLVELACNDDFMANYCSSVTVPVTFGNVYYVRLDTWDVSLPSSSLFVQVTPCPALLPGDECATAQPIVNGPNGLFDNTSMTNSSFSSGAPVPSCELNVNRWDRDMWFTYTATCNGPTIFETCGAGVDTLMAVYSGTCGSLVELGCSDDDCGMDSSVTVTTTTGVTYHVRLDTWSEYTPSTLLQMNVNPCGALPPPPNDECTGAVVVGYGVNGPYTNLPNGPYRGASTSPGAAAVCAAIGTDLWYRFTPNFTTPHTFKTCGSGIDTVLAVYNGSGGCAGIGAPMVCNDDFCATQSSLVANLTAGTPYYVRLGGWAGAQGNFQLEIKCGTDTGTIAMTTANPVCQPVGLALSVTGDPNIGGTVTATVTGFTGLPFVAYGFVPAPVLAPICPCQVLSVSANWLFTPSSSLTIPCSTLFLGLPLGAQGLDFLPPAPTCALGGSATDVWTITIG